MPSEKIKLKLKETDNEEEEDEAKDKDDKKKKKKKQPKEEEVSESSEDKTDKKKKKSKSKAESKEESKAQSKAESKAGSKVDSDEKTKDNDSRDKKETVRSKIVSAGPSTDVEKSQIKDIEDPMKDRNRLKILKKCVSHLCLLVLILGIKNVFLGFFAFYFYDNKTHLVIFGGLCIMQLIGAPVGWVAIQMGNRVLFLLCFIINLVWIISVAVLLLYYWLIAKTASFNQEIALHVGAIFYMSASITLAVCCFLMMQRLDMINIQYKKPEVHISTEGKASEKAKLKEKS